MKKTSSRSLAGSLARAVRAIPFALFALAGLPLASQANPDPVSLEQIVQRLQDVEKKLACPGSL